LHQARVNNDLSDTTSNAAELLNEHAQSRIILVCEHASKHFPKRYNDLGLSEADKTSHAAWDPGALRLSEKLSKLLDAALVASTVSRLVYDCNRPPTSPDAMRDVSEKIKIPGNKNLTQAQMRERVDTVYLPFVDLLSQTIKKRRNPPIIVTIHSFTKNYNGQERDTEIGIIHDKDTDLATAMVDLAPEQSKWRVDLNEPYSQQDGVAHTLQVHGTDNGLINVMIEVRNDLLETETQIDEMAKMLADLLKSSLIKINQPADAKAAI